jgi:hypothetical protein
MEMDEEGLLRKLAEVGSGPGGATAGKGDSGELYGLAGFLSGELYGLAGFFSGELRAAFDRVKLQLAVLDDTVGLDSISIVTSPKVAESFFRLVEKLVASKLARSDVFNKFSYIAKTATTGKKKGYAALWSSLYSCTGVNSSGQRRITPTPRTVTACVSTAFPTSMTSKTRRRHWTTACRTLRRSVISSAARGPNGRRERSGGRGAPVADALNASLNVNPVPPKRKADGVKNPSAQQHPAVQQTGRRPVFVAHKPPGNPRAISAHEKASGKLRCRCLGADEIHPFLFLQERK